MLPSRVPGQMLCDSVHVFEWDGGAEAPLHSLCLCGLYTYSEIMEVSNETPDTRIPKSNAH
jgi:hypothetical protein